MTPFAILWPTFAMVALVFAVLIKLVGRRMAHIRNNPPTRETFSTAESSRRYFEPVEGPAANLANLFETPVLFFALVPLLIATQAVTLAQVLLAWIYVGVRVLHSLVHTGKNDIRTRFRLFAVSLAVLSAMWVGFFVDALVAWRTLRVLSGLVAQP